MKKCKDEQHMPATWYITPNGDGARNGTSISNAFAANAVNRSCIKDGDIIWTQTIVDDKEPLMGEPFPAKHQEALNQLYESWGVGDSPKQRRAFWNSLQPNSNISHVETDEQWVKAFEFCWLVDQFPQDMTFC